MKKGEMAEITREEMSDPLAKYGTIRLSPSVPHYWGDASRQFMLAGAALLLLASPLYGENLRAEFPYEVTFALLAVGFAALTSPRERWVAFGDAVICAVGAAMYSIWGISGYSAEDPLAFVLRMAVAVVFLFAFYYSMKTVRAFSLSQVGRYDDLDDRTGDDREDTVEEEEMQLDQERGNVPINERII